jgi:hypothetical protein
MGTAGGGCAAVPLRSGSRVLAPDGIMPDTVWPPVCRVCSATERYRCPLRGIKESRAATVPPPVRIEHAVAYSLATASQSWSCSSRDRGHDRALAGLGRWSGLGDPQVPARDPGRPPRLPAQPHSTDGDRRRLRTMTMTTIERTSTAPPTSRSSTPHESAARPRRRLRAPRAPHGLSGGQATHPQVPRRPVEGPDRPVGRPRGDVHLLEHFVRQFLAGAESGQLGME